MEELEGDMQRADLVARLAAIPGSAPVEDRGDGLWISAPELDVEAMAREMKALGGRLVTMTGMARDRRRDRYHLPLRAGTRDDKFQDRRPAAARLPRSLRSPIRHRGSSAKSTISSAPSSSAIRTSSPLLRPAEVEAGLLPRAATRLEAANEVGERHALHHPDRPVTIPRSKSRSKSMSAASPKPSSRSASTSGSASAPSSCWRNAANGSPTSP